MCFYYFQKAPKKSLEVYFFSSRKKTHTHAKNYCMFKGRRKKLLFADIPTNGGMLIYFKHKTKTNKMDGNKVTGVPKFYFLLVNMLEPGIT